MLLVMVLILYLFFALSNTSLPTCNEAIRRMIFVLCEADRQNQDMFSDTWMFIANFLLGCVYSCLLMPAIALAEEF